MSGADLIVHHLLEEGPDDFDNEMGKELTGPSAEQVEAKLPIYGFEKQNGKWVRYSRTGKPRRSVVITKIDEDRYVISCYRKANKKWEYTHQWTEDLFGIVTYLERLQVRLRIPESTEEDDDWKESSLLFTTAQEANEWMNTQMPRMGFKWQDMGCRCWEREIRSKRRQVSVSSATTPGYLLLCRYQLTDLNRWQNEEMVALEAGEPVLRQLQAWGFL